MKSTVRSVTAALSLALTVAYGDEILFVNGDRISGNIVGVDDGKMVISSKIVGEVTVDMKNVKTFSSDAPIEVQFVDKTVVNQKVVAAGDGQFAVDQGAGQAPRVLPIASVDKINMPKVKWTGAVSAGMLMTRGNSYSDSANVAFEAGRRSEIDRLGFAAGYFYGRQEDGNGDKTTTTDNWFGSGKYDYFLSRQVYAYGLLRVERDRIAHLDLRVAPGIGVGYQWIERADLNVLTEGGFSYVTERYTDPDDTREYMAARLAYHVWKKVNDRLSLVHNLEYLPSLETLAVYQVNADAGVRASLTKSMFGEAKVVYNYNSSPAEGAERTDVKYILSVGWGF